MAYTEQQAKELVLEAGRKLVECGLIARTWGNVSARISDTQFIVTPSGRAYETLTADELVIVNIEDCSYEDDIKPSTETGIHADAFRLRPEVDFVIHTHQVKASVISATGLDIKNVPEKYRGLIGDTVPCGDYGMPSTDKLRKGVADAVKNNPASKGILMKHHGVLCLGRDLKEAFDIASALEELCETEIENNYLQKSNAFSFDETAMRNYYLSVESCPEKMSFDVKDLGSSVRNGDYFTLRFKDGSSYHIEVASCVSDDGLVPKAARLHSAIYKTSKVTHIGHLTDDDVVAVSMVGKAIKPLLDDFAQIAGPVIEVGEWNEFDRDNSANDIAKKLKGRNAVLIKGCGALCTGNDPSDVHAVGLVMAKGAQSQIGIKLFGKGKPLGIIDSLLMRTVYVLKYSKRAKEK